MIRPRFYNEGEIIYSLTKNPSARLACSNVPAQEKELIKASARQSKMRGGFLIRWVRSDDGFTAYRE